MKVIFNNSELVFGKPNGTLVFNSTISSSYSGGKLSLNLGSLTSKGISTSDTIVIVVSYPSAKAAIWGNYSVFTTSGGIVVFGTAEDGKSIQYTVNVNPDYNFYLSVENADSSGVDGDCDINVKIYKI